jgi:hypothetical protein
VGIAPRAGNSKQWNQGKGNGFAEVLVLFDVSEPCYYSIDSAANLRSLELAFPDKDNLPARPLKISSYRAIPLHIRKELASPKGNVRFWCRCNSAIRMTVPEAPMDEDRSSIPLQREIRLPRQIRRV